MAFAEPLANFFSLNEFAVTALYNGLAVAGIFDKPDSEHSLGAVGFEAAIPRFLMRDADLPSSYQYGDSLVVNGITYAIQAFQHDGQGLVYLILRA